ncbi:MAG: peptidyl-prolyl cis-trans isomerase [Gaiellaceae bacterium]
MKTRRIIALLGFAVVAVVVLAACGSKSKREVPANAIAVVGNEVVLRSQYDTLMAQSKAQYAQAKKAFPALGSTGYESIRDGIVSYLVQSAAIDQEAANMGIKVTDAEINSSLQQVIQQKFKGNKVKYQAELRKEHLTEQQLKDGLRENLISQRVQTQLIQNVKVSKSEIQKYYDEHKTNYKVGESRAVSHILVKTKAQAESIYRQLKAGTDFAKLAKKYSTDSTNTSGGSLGVQEKASLVPAFANALFALKTGALSQPVHTQFGWHVIRADGPIKPAHTQTLSEASATIEQTLLSPKQQQAVTNWVAQARKFATDNTSYAAGFEPPKSTTSTAATTTTS